MADPARAPFTILPDHPVQQQRDDRLDFVPYVLTLAEMIQHLGDEHTGLTIGVYGDWGSGKTSVMQLVCEQLKNSHHVIWFDAWRYSKKEEDLWVALMRVILSEVERASWWLTQWVNLKLWSRRFKWQEALMRLLLAAGIVWLLIGLLSFYFPQTQAFIHSLPFTEAVWWLSRAIDPETPAWEKTILTIAIALFLNLIKPLWFFLTALVTGELKVNLGHLTKPSTMDAYTILVDDFLRDFRAIVDTLGNHRPIVVFIDDLDRCSPDQIVPILEATKQFAGNNPIQQALPLMRPNWGRASISFVIGVDRQKIEQAIAAHYKDFAAPINIGDSAGPLNIPGTFAKDYLEKVMQITFELPPLSREQISELVKAITSAAQPNSASPYLTTTNVAEAIRRANHLFAYGVKENPRQVKRALNTFTLLWRIAEYRGSTIFHPQPRGRIQPDILALVVLIQYAWSDVYRDLLQYPNLLEELQALARASGSLDSPDEILSLGFPNPNALLEIHGKRNPRLLSLLRARYDLTNPTELSPAPLPGPNELFDLYLRLASPGALQTLGTIEVGAELMSGDPTRIRHAIRASSGDVTRHVDWLISQLESDDSPTQERALLALSCLADVRAQQHVIRIVTGDADQPHLYRRALYALSRFVGASADTEIRQALREVVRSASKESVRVAALKALTQHEIISEDDVQLIAAIVLESYRGLHVLRNVASRLIDPHYPHYHRLWDALETFAGQAVDDLEDNSPSTSSNAVGALNRFITVLKERGQARLTSEPQNQRTAQLLLQIATRPALALERDVINLLAQIQPSATAMTRLSQAFEISSLDLQEAIVEKLSNIEGAWPYLADIVTRYATPGTQLAVIRAAGRIPEKAAMAFLKKKLDDAATATAASEALRQLSKDHIPAHTREAAQTALEEWEGTQASPV